MKNRIKCSSILFATLASSAIYAQDEIDYGSASISPEYCVTIDADSPVKNFYVIDIDHLHISDEIQAIEKFGHIENNLISYSVDLVEQKAYLELHLDRTAELQDVLWWSAYLTSLCGL